MRFITRSFGRGTELLDLVNTLTDNTFISGMGISKYITDLTLEEFGLWFRNPGAFLVTLDAEQALVDMHMMNTMDRTIGRIGSLYAEALQDSNWYGGIRSNPFNTSAGQISGAY